MDDERYQNLRELIQDLRDEVVALKDQQEMMLELLDSSRGHFIYHMLEANATKAQKSAVYDLMDETRERLKKGDLPNHAEFERKVYEIIPSHAGDYHFAEGIVSTLAKDGKYPEVHRHFMRHGMNLMPIKSRGDD